MRNLYNMDDWRDVSCIRLGEILLESGRINLYHLSMVLDVQRFHNMPMGEIFLAMKVITEADLKQALKVQQAVRKRAESSNE